MEIDHLTQDLQASTPEIRLSLTRAGVTGVAEGGPRQPYEGRETVMAAEIECTVDLAHEQKGVHMSRFPELFEEAIEEVVGTEALHIETLAEHIARHIVGRQSALRAEAKITARWPVRRITPVSRLSTQEMVSLVGIAAASADHVRRVVGVEATGINACPCAQGLDPRTRGRAARRGGLRGRRPHPRARPARDPQPARPRHALRRAPSGSSTRTTSSRSSQDSMSAPIYELLKRPDELFVVEHAHLQPRFVEDSVRLSLKGALDAMPELEDGDFLFARQLNFETIHAHDVLAEREGTVGELRGGARRPASRRPAHQPRRLARRLAATRLGPPQTEAALGARCAAARCSPGGGRGRRRPRSRRTTITGQGSPERERRRRAARPPSTIDATDA